jgi:hypothetical protein
MSLLTEWREHAYSLDDRTPEGKEFWLDYFQKGLATAVKKAGRIAAEGIVMTTVVDGGKKAAMVEVNAETDFVAKNDTLCSDSSCLLYSSCKSFLTKELYCLVKIAVSLCKSLLTIHHTSARHLS